MNKDAHRLESLFSQIKLNPDNDIKLTDIKENDIGNMHEVTPKDILKTANRILLGLGIIYVFSCISFLIRPTEGLALLEICKVTLPPLATLIIAFYFKN